MRVLHIAAVQQPWVCFVENVANIMTMKDGAVWDAIERMVTEAGFVLHAQDV